MECWRPSPLPKRGGAPQFSVHDCCGQMARWIKMPLGTDVGVDRNDILFSGDPALPPEKRHRPHPIFGPYILWANCWMDQDATLYRGKPRPRRRFVRWGRRLAAPPKRDKPPGFGSCLLWPNGWMDEDPTWCISKPRPRPHCVSRGPNSPRKGHSSPPLFSPCLLWPRSPISAIAEFLLLTWISI